MRGPLGLCMDFPQCIKPAGTALILIRAVPAGLVHGSNGQKRVQKRSIYFNKTGQNNSQTLATTQSGEFPTPSSS